MDVPRKYECQAEIRRKTTQAHEQLVQVLTTACMWLIPEPTIDRDVHKVNSRRFGWLPL